MRYIILIMETHYPEGWDDYAGTAWTLKGAIQKAKDKTNIIASNAIYEIIDRMTLARVAVGRFCIGNNKWVEAVGDINPCELPYEESGQ